MGLYTGCPRLGANIDDAWGAMAGNISVLGVGSVLVAVSSATLHLWPQSCL